MAAVVLLGEGAAVEVVVPAMPCVSAMGAVVTGVGLGAGSPTGGLELPGDGLGLRGMATRFDGLFVALLAVGSCVGDALAGERLDASSTGALTDATLGAALSTVVPVLATVAGDAGLASVTLEAFGAT